MRLHHDETIGDFNNRFNFIVSLLKDNEKNESLLSGIYMSKFNNFKFKNFNPELLKIKMNEVTKGMWSSWSMLKSSRKCTFCGKPGHTQRGCYHKKQQKKSKYERSGVGSPKKRKKRKREEKEEREEIEYI